MLKKIAVVIGTRPEAIKMAPVILELRKYPKDFGVVVISSGQHRQMLDDPLAVFGIKPDYDLKIMIPSQSLFDISRRILSKMEGVLAREKPDLVLVHGDTPTTFMAGVAAYYSQIPVGHVEAGLRTYDKYHPFPEEMNRQFIDVVCDFYFAPTQKAKANLMFEGKAENKIVVTGNSVIDAVLTVNDRVKTFSNTDLEKIEFKNRRIIFLECHRREIWGKAMEKVFAGVKMAVDEVSDVEVLFPVHLNPLVQKAAKKILGEDKKFHLTKPLSYPDMVLVLKKCYLVATDSGGLVEEAPVFHKPLVVLRAVTERVEGLDFGTLVVGGIAKEDVYNSIKKLLLDKSVYQKMAAAKNPFGDGKAAVRIRKALMKFLQT